VAAGVAVPVAVFRTGRPTRPASSADTHSRG